MFRIVVFAVVVALPGLAFGVDDPLIELSSRLPEIAPDIERKDIQIPNIDSEFFEVGLTVGSLSVEDFGSHLTYGGQLNIHVAQSVFFKLKGSRSKVSDNVFRRLGLPLFDESGIQNLDQYSLLLGWNVFPGEIYLGEKYTLSSSAYIQGGAGVVRFSDNDYFGVSMGMGLRLLPVDWLSVTIEALGTEYNSTIFGFSKISHNFESNISVNVYF